MSLKPYISFQLVKKIISSTTVKNLDPNQRKISVAKAQEVKMDHLQALDGKVDNTFGIKVFKQSFIIFKNCSDLLVAAASNGKIQVCRKI